MPCENLPFLLLPCQESHTHVLGISFGFVWIPQAELRGASSFLHGLSEASYLCLPASCANPSLPHFVVVKVLSLGKIVVSLPGTSAAHSAGGRRGEKRCSEFLLGPNRSHKVILYMDRLVGFFCKGVDQEKLCLGSISRAGTPRPALCLWTLPCTYSPNPVCVFCWGCVCDCKARLFTISLCHIKSLLRIFRWQLHFCVAFREVERWLAWDEGRITAFFSPLCLTRGSNQGRPRAILALGRMRVQSDSWQIGIKTILLLGLRTNTHVFTWDWGVGKGSAQFFLPFFQEGKIFFL